MLQAPEAQGAGKAKGKGKGADKASPPERPEDGVPTGGKGNGAADGWVMLGHGFPET